MKRRGPQPNPPIGWEIYDKPAQQVDIRYLEEDIGATDCERSVRIDWEGNDIGMFAPLDAVDSAKGTVRVWVWDIGLDYILFELPGEEMNATGKRLWATREWLERMRVDAVGSQRD